MRLVWEVTGTMDVDRVRRGEARIGRGGDRAHRTGKGMEPRLWQTPAFLPIDPDDYGFMISLTGRMIYLGRIWESMN